MNKQFMKWFSVITLLLFLSGNGLAADQTIKATEEMVGSGHATKTDTLNRLSLVEHNTDGTHNVGNIFKPSIYTFTAWIPSTTTNVDTSPSAGTKTLENTDRCTMGTISSGTETFTFVTTGFYQVILSFKSTHAGVFTVSRGKFTLGGNATIYGSYASNNLIINDNTTDLNDGYGTVVLTVYATAGQTLTVKPVSNTTVDAVAQHIFNASVQVFPLG